MSSIEFQETGSIATPLGSAEIFDPAAKIVSAARTAKRILKAVVIRASLALFGMLTTLLFCEVALRIVFPSASSTNTPREVLAPRKIGYVLHASWQVQEPEFKTDISINSLGYRDAEIDISKPTVVFLGDSQTFGTGVNFGERASDIVRDSVANRYGVNVLNVSMPGASTFDERRLLLDVVKKGVKVSHVFVLVSTNDHYANLEDQDDPDDRDVEDSRSKRYSPVKQWIKDNRYRSRLVQFSFQRLSQLSWFQSLYADLKADFGVGELMALRKLYVDDEAARSQVNATKEALRSLNAVAPVTIVMVPDRYRVDRDLRETAEEELAAGLRPSQELEMDRESRLMKEAAAELNVEFLDPNDFFRLHADANSLAYPINGHLTAKGQRMLGEFIVTSGSYFQRPRAGTE